jgi:glycosyltransferase involved in cell wall biosynthesis
MKKLAILIVNINNLQYTKDCIADLRKQTNQDFEITLVDQGSTEEGTSAYLSSINDLKVIYNGYNKNLNQIWNEFQQQNQNPYLCYLNNDVRLTNNFVSDTIQILEEQPSVGCVVHATNSWRYNQPTNLEFVFSNRLIKQGWDFTIRREDYETIPAKLKFYFGDDWIFHHLYQRKRKVAVCLSSPIIHYGSKSAINSPISFVDVEKIYKQLGLQRNLAHYHEYSEIVPTYKNFGDSPLKTMVVLGMHRSATSLVAKSLNHEIFMGDNLLKHEAIDNPQGHYEDKDFIKLNDEILQAAGGSWFQPPPKEKILGVEQRLKDQAQILIALKINKALQEDYSFWGWKDPRTTFTLPIYLPHLPQPHFTFVARHPTEVAQSLVKRNKMSLAKAQELTRQYNVRLAEFMIEWNLKNP